MMTQLENQFLKEQIKKLNGLVIQLQAANKRAVETFQENAYLQEKATTLELKLNCLTETVEIQHLEACRRESILHAQAKDLSEHKTRINVLSDLHEENGYPPCNICFRHAPVMTICENHQKEDQVVGCIFCALKKCPMCRNTDVKQVFVVQNSSKKIQKTPKNTKTKSAKKTKK